MEPKGLEGTWVPTKAELAGEFAPEMVLEKMELWLHEGLYTVSFGGEVSDRGTYEVNAGAVPPMLQLSGDEGPNKGRTLPSLFQVHGDRMRICYGLAGILPVEFKAPAGSNAFLVNYKRKV